MAQYIEGGGGVQVVQYIEGGAGGSVHRGVCRWLST